MPTVRGVRLTLQLDSEHRAAAEYDAQADVEHGTASCFVQAETDRKFALRLDWLEYTQACRAMPAVALEVAVWIDGKGQHEEFHPMVHSARTFSNHERFDAARGVYINRPWRFAALQITEDEGMLPASALETLGIITVKVFRTIRLGSRSPPPPSTGADQPQAEFATTVSEKKLKGKPLTHTVALGEAQADSSRSINFARYESIDLKNAPLAKFTIYYRSKANLQSLGYIPETPRPSPTPDPNPLAYWAPSKMEQEEIRAGFLRARRTTGGPIGPGPVLTAAGIKRERPANDNDDELGFEEVDGSQFHRRKRISGPPEVIDLTGD